MSAFKAGDKIGYVGKSKIEYGHIVSIRWNAICGEEEYAINWNDGRGTETYLCAEVDPLWFKITDWDFNILTGSNDPGPEETLGQKLHFDGSELSWKTDKNRPFSDFRGLPDFAVDEHGNPIPATKACKHNFVTYHGLTDSFEYCTHCDEKKRG